MTLLSAIQCMTVCNEGIDEALLTRAGNNPFQCFPETEFSIFWGDEKLLSTINKDVHASRKLRTKRIDLEKDRKRSKKFFD